MPASRTRSLLRVPLPTVAATLSGWAALAGAAAAPWPWRLAIGSAAASGAAACAIWIGRRRARHAWESRLAAPSPAELAPSRRRGRTTPCTADRDVIGELLRDVRDAFDAADAVFWRVAGDGDGLVPAAAASEQSRWLVASEGTALGVIGWSAQERVAQYTPAEGAGGSLAAAPVIVRGALLGAISLHADAPLAGTPDAIKERLVRHALHLGDVVELVDTREEHERRSREGECLLAAASEFPQLRSAQELAAALCAAVLGVTGGDRAALVRWSAQSGRGRVDHVTAGWPGAVPRGVSMESLVGSACAEAMPQLWEDARLLGEESPLFATGERLRARHGLAIVPIGGRTGVLGAIVVESDEPGRLRAAELPTVRLLAAIASASIETLDDFETAEREAHTDPLTGLPNRRAFDAHFGPAIDRADRFDESVALIVCDVDEFKAVNDRHGHQVGDSVLQAIGAILQRGVRAVDLCARFGGEEFVVILPRTTRLGAVELAERLRRAIEARPLRVDGRELRITASFGIAIYPATVTSRDDLLAAADRALYTAKRDGRNCVRCADATAVFD